MKKISIVLSAALCIWACEEDLAVRPDGSDLQTAEVIVEELEVEGESAEQVFLVVEEQASFPGGAEAYNKYLSENLKYPKLAKDKGIEGKVYVSFIVDKEGMLSDFELIRGIGGDCDEEALRVFMESPNWIPGKQRGRAVKTKMQAVITFSLADEKLGMLEIQQPEKSKPRIREIPPPPPPIGEKN